jgi:uncharacterized membrane protein
MGFIKQVVNAILHLHPWHTLVVHFPVAFATVGVLCLLFAFWRRSELAEKFAFFCMAVTAAGTAMAGLAGLRDNAYFYGGAAPHLNLKIYLGVSLLILATATVLVRRQNPDLLWNPSTKILYGSTYVGAALLATVLGFVGGTILYGF